jgi:hypothetical protein
MAGHWGEGRDFKLKTRLWPGRRSCPNVAEWDRELVRAIPTVLASMPAGRPRANDVTGRFVRHVLGAHSAATDGRVRPVHCRA